MRRLPTDEELTTLITDAMKEIGIPCTVEEITDQIEETHDDINVWDYLAECEELINRRLHELEDQRKVQSSYNDWTLI